MRLYAYVRRQKPGKFKQVLLGSPDPGTARAWARARWEDLEYLGITLPRPEFNEYFCVHAIPLKRAESAASKADWAPFPRPQRDLAIAAGP